MRKLFTIPFFLCSLIITQAQILTGLDAAKRVPGADEICMDPNGDKAIYIHFSQPNNLLFENFNYWATHNLGFKGNNSLVQIGMEKDALGMIHYRYQQYFNGKPIQYSMIIVHTLKGRVVSLNGEYYPALSDVFQQNFNEAEALQKALDNIGAATYAWQDIQMESIQKYIENSGSATYFPKGELVYVSKNNSLQDEDFRLAYKFNIYSVTPLNRVNIFVDASNGEILFTENLIHTSDVTGTAHTKYSGVKSFTTDSTGPGNYRLRETGRGLGIETYNLKKATNNTAAVDFIDTNNDWNNINPDKDEVATDAHWGAEQTYDYFKIAFNRNSINNAGFKLRSYVHYSTNYNNAFWNGQYMTYGDGNGTVFTPLTALDVCGHEIAHGLTSNTANLVYQNESGALNESFSDIFGTTIEFFGRNGAGNWKIGEDMTPSAAGIRNMQNPKQFSNPNTYLTGQFWHAPGGTDNGGVHTNSGVQNYWFYLMSQGGSGTNDNGKVYNVPGMGRDKAAAIAFRTLTVYLSANSQFANARYYSILAAKDLYGPCAAEVKTTTNTWAAVGVGNDFDTTLKAIFNSTDTLICGTTGTAAFINNSTNAATYLWDFGDGTATSSLTNPTHTYTATGNYTVKLKVSSCTTPVKFDSMTRVSYIKVSTTDPTCLSQRMPNGTATGSTITLCAGKLMDNGGTANYSNNTNSTRTISPSGAGYLRIKFNSFNFEDGLDFLYIYDGPTITSPLIGKFTGSALPKGGTIYSSQGSLTFVQSTDGGLTLPGFDLDWQCYAKSSNDIAVIGVVPIASLRLNTPVFTTSSTVAAIIKNVGTVAQSNIPVSYNVNGGAPVSAFSNPGLLLPNDIDTVVFTTPIANNIGVYNLKVFNTLSTDTVRFNDTTLALFKIVENDPVTLPFIEGFENMNPDSSNYNVFSLTGAGKLDYDNNDSIHYCRFRSRPINVTTNNGSRMITFDRSAGNTDAFSNFLTLTLNLSNYITQNKVYLEFYYRSHGDESQANDRVWIRGNMNDNWIEVYNLKINDTTANSNWYKVTGIPLDSILKLNAQSLSTNTQIRWGQQDNNRANDNIGADGMSFDDIRVYAVSTAGIKNSQITNDDIYIYPNPAKNNITVYGFTSSSTITLMDAAGKVISVTYAVENTTINTSNLAKGIYLLNITNGKKNVTKKLVIE